MRKLAIAVALASTALATPALARDKAWYVGVEGGAMIVEDIHFDITSGATKTKDAAQVDHEYGYDVGGTVGYDFGMFRVEAEVAYKGAASTPGVRRCAPRRSTRPVLRAFAVPGTLRLCRWQNHCAELHAQRHARLRRR